eukprot:845833-Pelagomonas_calceolata.AAC.1
MEMHLKRSADVIYEEEARSNRRLLQTTINKFWSLVVNSLRQRLSNRAKKIMCRWGRVVCAAQHSTHEHCVPTIRVKEDNNNKTTLQHALTTAALPTAHKFGDATCRTVRLCASGRRESKLKRQRPHRHELQKLGNATRCTVRLCASGRRESKESLNCDGILCDYCRGAMVFQLASLEGQDNKAWSYTFRGQTFDSSIPKQVSRKP